MEADIKIRCYEAGDEKNIVELLELAFDGWPQFDLPSNSLDYWVWKFKDNPCGKSAISVAECGGMVIGCQHWYPQVVKYGHEKHRCLHGADAAIHPDYRRMGVYNKTTEMLTERMSGRGYLYNHWVSSNPIVIKSSTRKNSVYGKIRNLVHVKDVDKQLKEIPMKNSLYVKWGYLLLKNYNRLKNRYRVHYTDGDTDIRRVKIFDEGFNKFWSKVAGDYGFIINRDKEYMNWRYCDPRGGSFVVNQAEEKGEVAGYSVLLTNKLRDYHVGYIVDVLALPRRPDIVHALAEDAVNFFNENDVNIINYQVVKDHPYQEVFKRHGFLDCRVDISLFYRLLGSCDKPENCSIESRGRVFLTYGDHDSFPATHRN